MTPDLRLFQGVNTAHAGGMVEATLVARDACAWPVLLALADGSLVMVFHNRPSHGFEEGDLVARVSHDDGRTWSDLGVPAPHLPQTSRVHAAAGVDHAGQCIVLSTGHKLLDGAMVGLAEPWCSLLRPGDTRWMPTTPLKPVPQFP